MDLSTGALAKYLPGAGTVIAGAQAVTSAIQLAQTIGSAASSPAKADATTKSTLSVTNAQSGNAPNSDRATEEDLSAGYKGKKAEGLDADIARLNVSRQTKLAIQALRDKADQADRAAFLAANPAYRQLMDPSGNVRGTAEFQPPSEGSQRAVDEDGRIPTKIGDGVEGYGGSGVVPTALSAGTATIRSMAALKRAFRVDNYDQLGVVLTTLATFAQAGPEAIQQMVDYVKAAEEELT